MIKTFIHTLCTAAMAGLLVISAGSAFGQVTEPPILITPAANAASASPVGVSFVLPESALAGSVTLTFTGTVTRVLTLAGSQESSGAHSFSFPTAAPTTAPEVASGAAIPEGVYAVTLSYQDAAGSPASTATSVDVVVDTTEPTIGPFGDMTIQALNNAGAVVEYATAGSDSGSGVASFNIVPASGSLFAIGSTTVNAVATDRAGNSLAISFIVRVLPRPSLITSLGSRGAVVPGAGAVGSGIPAGATWQSFGVPSVNDVGRCAVLATFRVGTVNTIAILSFDLADMAGTMRVLARKGDAAPGIANAVMSALKDPLLAPDGSVAWEATLANAPATTGAVTSLNNSAIYLDADGAGAAAAIVVARKGAVADGASAAASIPAGVAPLPVWGTFTSIALSENAVAFTATLASRTPGLVGAPGPGGVTALTDGGLWVYDRASAVKELVIREGSGLFGITVGKIDALVARPGSAGQGHGVMLDRMICRFTFSDSEGAGRTAFGQLSRTGLFSTFRIYPVGGYAFGYGAGSTFASFGLPTQSGAGGAAFVAKVTPLTGTATAANNVAIFAGNDPSLFGLDEERMVAKGDAAAGVSAGIFSTFKDPVNADNRSVAFQATLATNAAAGINATNNDGIWHVSATEALRLIAREGAHAAETPAGTTWTSFTSLALPEGRGPLFVAKLANGGTTTANDMGLWAADSTGALRLLLREGDALGTSTVQTFTVLSTVLGSPAQTRSFNNGGSIILRATDATGAQHLLSIAVP